MANIKSIMDKACEHLKVDAHLSKQVHNFAMTFLNKYVEFFGGNLTGVHPIRFLSTDKYEWLEELIGIDEYDVKAKIVKLPSIDENWKRATDMVNISCVYLVHKIATSDMDPVSKEQAMTDVLLVMQYKLLCSLIVHYYPYQVDESTAQAVYASLTKKYALKQHGSWQAVLVARCKDIINQQGIHWHTIERFDDDAAIVYMISDIQIRLRAMIKKLTEVFYEIRRQDKKIMSTSGKVEMDGQDVVKDVSRNFTPYQHYMNEIVTDPRRFIKPELINIICELMPTMSETLFSDALVKLVEKAGANDKHTLELLNEILLHAFDYLHNDPNAAKSMKDYPKLLAKLRALYMASRSSDEGLLKMRDLGEKVLKQMGITKNVSMIAALRTGIFLYTVLRIFTKQHYN